jgi:alpha-amylase
MSELNGVMMQYFHWYIPGDGTLWEQVAQNAGELSKTGITALWLPPAYKGIGGGLMLDTGSMICMIWGNLTKRGRCGPSMVRKSTTFRQCKN